MTSITFAVSKGGVGKSLITANVGASLASKGKKVVLIEGDPNRPLQTILGISASSKHDLTLDEVVKKNADVQRAVDPTSFDNLYLMMSGVSLQDYLEMDPLTFARKLSSLKTDYLFIDVPFPLGKAALLSLGVCEYFIPILTEDEFVLCVESAIDTIRLGKYLLKCVPIGFILNRIKNQQKFNKNFVKDLEDLLEIPCITQIKEHSEVSKSYGGVESQKAFLAYDKLGESEFTERIDDVASFIEKMRPKPEKKDSAELLQRILKP